jgi:hypothetical protein
MDAMALPTATVPSPEHHRAPVGRIVMTVVGALLIVISLGFGAIGGVLTWAHATQRDSDGFFTSGTHRLESITAAITSEDLDLGVGPGRGDRDFDLGDVATVRLRAESQAQRPIFIGIGPARDVDAYLANVAHAEIDSIDFRPFRVTYDVRAGAARATPPGSQNFWAASAQGVGAQQLEWDLESGRWTIVVMNANGARGVAVDADAGVKADWVLPLGIGLLVGFGAFALLGTVLLVVGAAGLGRRVREPATPGSPPVQLTGVFDADLSRWLWLVKWILLIPHFIALAVLWLAFAVVSFIAFFAILFTGRYPRALFDFNAGVLRWSWRVGFYSFAAFGTDSYPPFTLGAAPDYPARLEIAYPERLSRGLVLVKWWLLAIPQYVVLGIFGGGVWLTARDDAWAAGGPGLIGWLVFVAVVALLFVGRYPRGIADLVVGLNRWIYRVIVYAALMSDAYPPFRLDQGETEAPAEPTDLGVT